MADRDQSQTSNRGFASMDEKKQRAIAGKGGQGSGGNFANDPERAAEAGRKGGEHSHGGQTPGGHQGRGNFAEDRERESEAGREGGEHSRGNR